MKKSINFLEAHADGFAAPQNRCAIRCQSSRHQKESNVISIPTKPLRPIKSRNFNNQLTDTIRNICGLYFMQCLRCGRSTFP